jgi:hypothetical protein
MLRHELGQDQRGKVIVCHTGSGQLGSIVTQLLLLHVMTASFHTLANSACTELGLERLALQQKGRGVLVKSNSEGLQAKVDLVTLEYLVHYVPLC